ncbi:MAG: nucleoside hydrolase [Oscillospiraceae bacterium]|nr:nucleoside hydrolase [Oscillospiraceae bacterium]
MKKIPVWMDCDTGTDDAIAILLAHALEELDLLAISTVCGNTSQENAFRNTHGVVGLTGVDYPVFRGAEKPLLQKLEFATAFHGENGLGNVELPIPEQTVFRAEKAWDALYACAAAHPHELRLVATAPLTNVATAFVKYPELPHLLHSLCLMGGSAGPGNITPAAEFNIYIDPQAAEIVFHSGVKLVMFGLDVTLQEKLVEDDLDELGASGSKAGEFAGACLRCALEGMKRYGINGVSMHDSCPVMYLAHPELFDGEEAGVVVETRGSITNGKTVTDLYSDKQFPFKNALVMLKVDAEAFIRILKKRIVSIE